MRFAAIAGWADSGAYPVSFMCAWLGVSRSGYYAWRGAEPSQRSRDDSALIAVMKKVYDEARGNPGVRRVRAGLAALGHLVSHKRVHRLMQAAGLRGRHPKAWKRTTIGGDQPVPAPDLIGRDFTAALPDMRWCGDVTRGVGHLARSAARHGQPPGHRPGRLMEFLLTVASTLLRFSMSTALEHQAPWERDRDLDNAYQNCSSAKGRPVRDL